MHAFHCVHEKRTRSTTSETDEVMSAVTPHLPKKKTIEDTKLKKLRNNVNIQNVQFAVTERTSNINIQSIARPTNRSATARQAMNTFVTSLIFSNLATANIVKPFPKMARNEKQTQHVYLTAVIVIYSLCKIIILKSV